ncbi:MAG TPA: Glu/Leu/Phe/Val dehydrogenase dimerization domain-containing protein [Polyangia bacterium]|nr:Glu/Leu/Phe/Val dehydrogenase dimerization domain-containing protein [Polyangia bacterium]
MSVFDHEAFDGHEHVSFFAEPSVGLRAIIAIHRTGPLGMAGGGCRMWPYRDERAALADALRLSRAMTYKLALLEMPAGGAKAVVIGDSKTDKSEALLLALGRAVERLGGRFVIAEDVGTSARDLEVVARATSWVNRAAADAGDTAGATAYGVVAAMRAAVKRRLGRADLDGLRVAVQGLGHVGGALCRELARAGAQLVVADVDAGAVSAIARELGARAVAPEEIFDQPADVFAPCALADALDDGTVPRLRCAVIAGSANNQLAHPRIADALAARDILWAPDIVANAGGVIASASRGGDERVLRARLDGIGALVEAVFARAERERISTHEAAERTARERLAGAGGRP